MFASSTLPHPASFAGEHRPLRLTAEPGRPQPQGGCHFQISSELGRTCPCQTYHHDRSYPGNACDCGHSACYHSQSNTERRLSPDRVVGALVEKVKKLEDLVIKEREARNTMLSRERLAWEREVRVLREALAPFYHSDSEMKRELNKLGNRLDATSNEQSRLRERLLAIDDASTTLEKRLEDYEISHKGRKRKASIGHDTNGVVSPKSSYTRSSSSAASDIVSTSTHVSPQPSSPVEQPPTGRGVFESPRSSGVLNHEFRHPHHQAYQAQFHQIDVFGPKNEPRSSGFLSIDLVERLRDHRMTDKTSFKESFAPTNVATANVQVSSTHTIFNGLPSPPQSKISSGALPLSGLLLDCTKYEIDTRSSKRYKQQQNGGMMALEILANATVDHPIA